MTDDETDAEDQARHARLRAPDALANAARYYAAAGIAIFPCVPRGKRPLTAHGFHEATVDVACVDRWWTRWPDANIGAPTGITFDVVDVDGPAGVIAISPYVEGIRAASIGLVSTPRPGGLHYYLPPDVSHKNRAAVLPHVDTRGAGGYVVLPPSVTDDHGPGRYYTWIRPLRDLGAS